MSRNWSNKETYKFIELYRREACLWDPRHAYNKDKTKLSEAWERISAGMEIPIDDLKRKKETLMSAYRLNLKKVQTAHKTGVTFTPIWVFYDAMSEFLSEVYDNKNGNSFSDDGTSHASTSNFLVNWNPVVEVGIEQLSNDECSQHTPAPAKRRRSSSSEQEPTHYCEKYLEKTMTTITGLMNIVSTELLDKRSRNTNEDECDLYCKLLAMKLRRLPDMERQEFMFEIDTLYIQKRLKDEPL